MLVQSIGRTVEDVVGQFAGRGTDRYQERTLLLYGRGDRFRVDVVVVVPQDVTAFDGVFGGRYPARTCGVGIESEREA